MRCDSGSWRSPQLPYAPATLKYRSETAASPCAAASPLIMWSTASLDAPYGLVGRGRVGLGDRGRRPARRTSPRWRRRRACAPPPRASRRAVPSSRRRCSPSTSPAWRRTRRPARRPRSAARRRSEASSHSAASWMSPSMKAAPAGTPSRNPVERLSSTVTWWPASSRCCATTLPTYPAPPVPHQGGVPSCSLARYLSQSLGRGFRRHIIDEHAHTGLGTREELQLAGSAADGEKLEMQPEVVPVGVARTAPGARRRCTASAVRPSPKIRSKRLNSSR